MYMPKGTQRLIRRMNTMNEEQWRRVEEQLPEGAKILRTYRAFETAS
jgi:hypothetical protein